jgi:hypothetical protein
MARNAVVVVIVDFSLVLQQKREHMIDAGWKVFGRPMDVRAAHVFTQLSKSSNISLEVLKK